MEKFKAWFVATAIMMLVGIVLYLFWEYEIGAFWVLTMMFGAYGFARFWVQMAKFLMLPPIDWTKPLPRHMSLEEEDAGLWERQ